MAKGERQKEGLSSFWWNGFWQKVLFYRLTSVGLGLAGLKALGKRSSLCYRLLFSGDPLPEGRPSPHSSPSTGPH